MQSFKSKRPELWGASLSIAFVCVALCGNNNASAQERAERGGQMLQEATQREAPAEVQWLHSATEAARLAKRTGKPILVYVRSESCVYCDKLQKDTWQDPKTQAIVMRDMIPLKLTLEDNRDAVEAMKVKGFPSTILFSPGREYLARIDGYVTPQEFLARIATVRVEVSAKTESVTVR